METTLDFIHRLQDHFDNHTVYGLAKRLGLPRSAVYHWTKHNGTFGEDTAIQVADILGENPEYIVACCYAERAKNQDVKRIWENLAKLAKKAASTAHAAAILLVFSLMFSAPDSAYAGAKNEGLISCNSVSQTSNKDYRKLYCALLALATLLYFLALI